MSEKPAPARLSKLAPTPAPPGDHRKRRRNRTTQSCLNCHASKRMCDRKRPACQRCTTLGITGLCVYEVDDPSQRDNLLDEKSLLRNRVAELEGVIRELKNKPHPRWAQRVLEHHERKLAATSGNDLQQIDSSADNETRIASEDAQRDAATGNLRLTMPSIQFTPAPISPETASSCDGLLSPHDKTFLSPHSYPSSACNSSSSSLSSSPTPSNVSLPRVAINEFPVLSSTDFGVENILAAASLEPSGFEEGIYGRMLDNMMHIDHNKANKFNNYDEQPLRPDRLHGCSCVTNPQGYSHVLELSVRLRRAAEALARLPEHHRNDCECGLFTKITELDGFTSSVIGNSTSPVDRLPTSPLPSALQTEGDYLSVSRPSTGHGSATVSPISLSVPHWAAHSARSVPPSEFSDDDPFMSWENNHQQGWFRASSST